MNAVRSECWARTIRQKGTGTKQKRRFGQRKRAEEEKKQTTLTGVFGLEILWDRGGHRRAGEMLGD